jgi:hypothetical protein
MAGQGTSEEKLLDPEALRAFQDLVGDLREALLNEAAKLAPDGHITDEHLIAAYKVLSYPSRDSLQFADAQAIISQALRENRLIEWVSYVMASVLFGFGLILLSIGTFAGDVATRSGCLAAGTIVELLILVPFRFAINSRRHNIALRMLGLIINRVNDPKKLAPLLKDTFVSSPTKRQEAERGQG